ncbi:hypothetical protein [Rothia sp. ZJ1223]|uniref:hypothetical protein n=1 Tax=Rothia sp. ZJ1223 TaxID=2811098 RepID=UPI001956A907|nr:hypothetical protein [Rothia sp. ZJ1223]MBM7052228.1 hypothetical protein [Rothia sp. ZJ1223]
MKWFNCGMGLLSKLFGPKAAKTVEPPLLYKGELIEQDLYPLLAVHSSPRGKVLAKTGRRSKVFWCTFSSRKQVSGKYAGSDIAQILVDGKVVGELEPRYIAKRQDLIEALNSGINAATVWIRDDGDGVSAVLRLGEHKYMPPPYWK